MRGTAASAVWARGWADMRGSRNGAIRTRDIRDWRWSRSVAVFALAVSVCDWTTFRHDNAHSGFMPLAVGPADPTALAPRFTVTTGGPVFSSAAIVHGVAYVGSLDGFLYAFDADRPHELQRHSRRLRAVVARLDPERFPDLLVAAVAGGIVYVGSDDGLVYAFDADGNTGCSGTPKVCTPLFAGQTTSNVRSSPTVENGVLYIGSVHNTIEVFDANGNTNCSGVPKACAPLWTGTAPGILGEQLPPGRLERARVRRRERRHAVRVRCRRRRRAAVARPRCARRCGSPPTTFGAGMRSSPAVRTASSTSARTTAH